MITGDKNPELDFWKQWLEGPWSWLGSFDTCQKAIKSESLIPISSRRSEITEFCTEQGEWERVYQSNVIGKTCMDVGCGMDGLVPFWRDASRKILIDPLINEYSFAINEYMNSRKIGGINWIKDNELYPFPAYAPQLDHLVGAVDGVLVFRNAMDHDSGKQSLLLERVLSFASSGCLLFFWTELTHLHLDPGHHDSELSKEEILNMLTSLKFNILRHVTPVHGPRYKPGIDFGCVAKKI